MGTKLAFILLAFIVISTHAHFDKFKKLGRNDLDKIKRAEEIEALSPPKNSHPVMSKVFAFLTNTVYIKRLGFNAKEQLCILKEYMLETGLKGHALFKNMSHIFPGGSIFKSCDSHPVYSDSSLPFPYSTSCCPIPDVKCGKNKKKYRTIDGSCNCLKKSNMGRSNRAYARLLQPDYEDGLESPRAAKSGNPLPSARKVSTVIYEEKPNEFSPVLTIGHMTFGQVVDHDTDRTPVNKFMTPDDQLVDVMCGTSGCNTTGPENAECFPIPIPNDDPCFTKECLMFVRSQAFMKDKCEIGPREQANVITSWLDASHVYGNTKAENDVIRDFSDPLRGKMITTVNPLWPDCGPLLPHKVDKSCRDLNDDIKCFLTGDARQNEQNALTSYHIISVRLHNKFEEELHNLNPNWDGERLFQEARRIVIAVWQNMVYREYLPPLLGPKIMKKFDLDTEKGKKCFKGHDCKKYNGDVMSVFATAAFRFGHSQVGDFLMLANDDFSRTQDLHFSSVLFRPRTIYEKHFDNTTCGVDAILLGHAAQRADQSDRFFTKQMSKHMFTETPPKGLGADLPALNTQRGRDHGLPGYTKWRKVCGLSVPSDFHDMDGIPKNVQDKLKSLYEHVDDVDLFPAAMSEDHIKNGIVGPTFSCLLAHQFRNIKFADRFYFEGCKSKKRKIRAFNKDQLKNIREYSLGRFYCDTLKNVKTIQPFPLWLPMSEVKAKTGKNKGQILKEFPFYRLGDNERVLCEKLPELDIGLWKD